MTDPPERVAPPPLPQYGQQPSSAVQIGDAIGRAPEQGMHRQVVCQWETSWRRVTAAVLVFLAAVFGAYRFAIPVVAEAVAYQVPAGASEVIGGEVLEFLDQRLLAPSALPQARQDVLVAAFRRLRMPATSREANYRIEFRRGTLLGPNALALPSGVIIVTDELIALARDDREILGVLAHEAGHVDRRHGLRQMLQSSIVGLLVAWYVGDVSTIAAAGPTALIEAKYSRDLEREADAYAAALLRDNRIEVRHLIDLLQRLEAQADAGSIPDGLKYLSSHPATSERLRQLQESR